MTEMTDLAGAEERVVAWLEDYDGGGRWPIPPYEAVRALLSRITELEKVRDFYAAKSTWEQYSLIYGDIPILRDRGKVARAAARALANAREA